MKTIASATYVRDIRITLGLTQTQLADKLGVSYVTVNRWENGRNIPSVLALQRLKNLANDLPRPRRTPPRQLSLPCPHCGHYLLIGVSP